MLYIRLESTHSITSMTITTQNVKINISASACCTTKAIVRKIWNFQLTNIESLQNSRIEISPSQNVNGEEDTGTQIVVYAYKRIVM